MTQRVSAQGIVKTIIGVGLILLPLCFSPVPYLSFESPKVTFLYIWVEVLTTASILLWGKLNINRYTTRILKVAFVFFIFALISSIFGVDKLKSLSGNYYRRDGLVTLLHLLTLGLVIEKLWNPKWQDLLVKCLTLGSSLVSIFAILSFYFPKFTSFFGLFPWSGAVGSTFGQPNFMAGYLVVIFPLLWESRKGMRSVKSRLTISFLYLIQIWAIYLSGSRAALAGIGIYTFWKLLIPYRISIKSRIVIFILVVATVLIIFKENYSDQFYRTGEPGKVNFEGRERIWRRVFLGALRKPILGWGWANVDYAYESIDWPLKINNDIYVDKAHFSALEVFATTGLLGATVYMILLFLVIKTLYGSIFFWPLILYVFHSQTNITSIAQETIFWVLLGIAASGRLKKLGFGELD